MLWTTAPGPVGPHGEELSGMEGGEIQTVCRLRKMSNRGSQKGTARGHGEGNGEAGSGSAFGFPTV